MVEVCPGFLGSSRLCHIATARLSPTVSGVPSLPSPYPGNYNLKYKLGLMYTRTEAHQPDNGHVLRFARPFPDEWWGQVCTKIKISDPRH